MRVSTAGATGSGMVVRVLVTTPNMDTKRVALLLSSLRGSDDDPSLVTCSGQPALSHLEILEIDPSDSTFTQA